MGILNRLANRSFEINHPTTSSSGFGLTPNMPSRFEYRGENSEIRPEVATSKQAPRPLTPVASNETVSFDVKTHEQTGKRREANPKIKNSTLFTKAEWQVDIPSPDYIRRSTEPNASPIESKNSDAIIPPRIKIDIQENLDPKTSLPDGTLKTPATSKHFEKTLKTPEFVQSETKKTDRNEQSDTGFEEISIPSYPERLQPFIQPFESYLSTASTSVFELDNPLQKMGPTPSPDVIIQIDHIEIQVEKKTPRRAQKREPKKAQLTDLSNYLSDQRNS